MKNILIFSVILGLFLIGCSVEPVEENDVNPDSNVVTQLPLPTIFNLVAVNTLADFNNKLLTNASGTWKAVSGVWFHDGALRSSFPAEDDGTNVIKIKSNCYGRAVTVNLRFYCVSSNIRTIQVSNNNGVSWYNTAIVPNSMAGT